MNDGTTLARVLALIGDALGVPAAEVRDDAPLGEQGLDSLDTVELAMEVEEHFSMRLGDEDEEQIELKHTPRDIAALVDAQLAPPRPDMEAL